MGKSYKIISGILVLLAVACFVLFFVFKNNSFTVTFDSAGGSEIAPQKVKEKELAKSPSNPSREGFMFNGWQLDGALYDFSTPVTKDITLIADWLETYEVTVSLDGENYTRSYVKGDTVKINDFDFPTKEGYKVKLFYDAPQEEKSTEERKEYDLSSEIVESLSLYGEYYELQHLTVKFDSAGGTPIADISILEDEKITAPTVTREGFTFEGWFLEDKIFDFEQPVTQNITLVANWRDGNKVNVNFFVDGKKYDTVLVAIGSKVRRPADPVKEGYVFEGWRHNNKIFDFESTIEDTLTLSASFREAKVYKVTFNSEGGSDVPAQDIYEGGKVSKPANPTKDGMQFVEWTFENQPYDFEKKVSSHMTLKAKWKVIEDFTVSFNSDGGSNVPAQTVKSNGSAIRPTDPTKDGMKFVEWQLNGKTYDFSSPVNSNISLKAIWRMLEEYTVSFDSDGGDIINNQFVREGSTVVRPADPTKANSTFIEWQLNGKTYDFSKPVTGNITLKALWS